MPSKNGFDFQKTINSGYIELKTQERTLPSARTQQQKFNLTTKEIVKKYSRYKGVVEDILEEEGYPNQKPLI